MRNRGRILIVDDEDTFLRSTADWLRKEHFECDCAADASEAAGMLQKGKYELLISDIEMPGNIDMKLIGNVRETNRGLPVIIVTGYPSVNTAVRAVHLSVVAYLIKPLDVQELLKYVLCSIAHFRIRASVIETQERLKNWHSDLQSLEQVIDLRATNESADGITGYVSLILQNINASLNDLKELTESLAMIKAPREMRQIAGLPEVATMRGAISETVDVLARTKRSFKSKDLGTLRVKLEGLLNSNKDNLRILSNNEIAATD